MMNLAQNYLLILLKKNKTIISCTLALVFFLCCLTYIRTVYQCMTKKRHLELHTKQPMWHDVASCRPMLHSFVTERTRTGLLSSCVCHSE